MKKEKLFTPTLIKLGMVSLFADIASEMLYPITPIFLTAVLGASMASLGLIEGVAEATASLLKAYSGAWSDRIDRRKPFVVTGYLFGALGKPLIGLSSTWIGVLGARSVDRFGKGIRGGPRDALLAESVPNAQLGAAFGWHRAMDTLGAAIGPLLAIAYLQLHGGELRSIYFWSLIPGALSVAFALSVAERKHEIRVEAAPRPAWSLRDFSPAYWRYLVAWGIFSLVNSSDVFLLMRAKQAGLSLITVILFYCFYNLTYALGSPYLGSLSDRWGRPKILAAGLAVFALVYAGFSRATHPTAFWVLFGVYGLYMAATDGVGKSLAIDLVPKERKATGIGILGTVTGISTLFASVVAGILWDHFGPTAALLYGSVGALVAAILLLTMQKAIAK